MQRKADRKGKKGHLFDLLTVLSIVQKILRHRSRTTFTFWLDWDWGGDGSGRRQRWLPVF